MFEYSVILQRVKDLYWSGKITFVTQSKTQKKNSLVYVLSKWLKYKHLQSVSEFVNKRTKLKNHINRIQLVKSWFLRHTPLVGISGRPSPASVLGRKQQMVKSYYQCWIYWFWDQIKEKYFQTAVKTSPLLR
jgi:hypothetical protein